MKIGLVCPYDWGVPGGVQHHVRDLACHVTRRGHQVSVIAPADDEASLPAYLTPAGRSVAVPYNGSVARLSLGPRSATRVRRWLREGNFDVLHIHEPIAPSLSLLACWVATGPIVATFHACADRSWGMAAAYPLLRPALQKIRARIAVSEDARRTLAEHGGGDAVIIPNGVDVSFFASAESNPVWHSSAGTLGFIGRLDEPRKGFATLLKAFTLLAARRPGVRLLVAGRGDIPRVSAQLPAPLRQHVTFLGQVSDADKARLLRTVDLYVAPNLGGESFGIILIEAMSAGVPVLASDLDSFRRVLEDGQAGELVPVGDATALANAAERLLDDPGHRQALRTAGAAVVRRYDWSTVATEILGVYQRVTDGAAQVAETDIVRGTTPVSPLAGHEPSSSYPPDL